MIRLMIIIKKLICFFSQEKEIGYIKFPKIIFSWPKGVSVYCFKGLSHERLKNNMLPFWGNILLASLWDKTNLNKFSIFYFTL